MENQVEKQEQFVTEAEQWLALPSDKKIQGMLDYTQNHYKGIITKVLEDSKIDYDVYMANIKMAFVKNENLIACLNTKLGISSVFASIVLGASLGLALNDTRQLAFLLPRKYNNIYLCNFQIGYHGRLELLYRTGKIASVYANHNDKSDIEFSIEYFTGQLTHKPSLSGRRDNPLGFYVIIEYITPNGGTIKRPYYMTKEDVWAIKDMYVQTYGSSKTAWDKDPNFNMAKKTVLIQALKMKDYSIADERTNLVNMAELSAIGGRLLIDEQGNVNVDDSNIEIAKEQANPLADDIELLKAEENKTTLF